MNGAIVSNTGPLVALAVINQLDLLRLLFDDVMVPEAVHHDLLAGGMNQAGLAAYQLARWMNVIKPAERLDPLLASVLDSGEASVIQLARERGIACVLIDERKGRQIAREVYQLQVIGSARVLLPAWRLRLRPCGSMATGFMTKSSPLFCAKPVSGTMRLECA